MKRRPIMTQSIQSVNFIFNFTVTLACEGVRRFREKEIGVLGTGVQCHASDSARPFVAYRQTGEFAPLRNRF